ncbi:hypothetical protein QYF50_06495 [Paenibacillus vini]|uniref:hypothetical protein n=1 Tax=Paenibacillus vini TaxID=1476024 RepID=UPI0025B6D3E1|nr:hypothetical protein [Paenibacillus vini]MDN4067540.1 hypothetical protein [Paenibacillus vini]
MRIRYIAFKWHVEAPFDAVAPVLKQIGLIAGRKNTWTRQIGEHTLLVEHREKMSSKERSYFWLRFFHPIQGKTEKELLDRALSDLYFTMSHHFITCVNWLQVAIELHNFRAPYGFRERTEKIWSKKEGRTYYSIYPIHDFYYFEVHDVDISKPIQHRKYSTLIDELSHNLLGHELPDDQIRFDLIV